MILLTHLSLGLLTGLLMLKLTFIPVNHFVFLVAMLIGSILPDIDTATSFIGSKLRIVSLFFKHRGAIHSFTILVACTILFYILTTNAFYSLAFASGYLSHLLLDSLTPKGVLWLWPSKKRVRGVFRTAGLFDFLFLVLFSSLNLAILL